MRLALMMTLLCLGVGLVQGGRRPGRGQIKTLGKLNTLEKHVKRLSRHLMMQQLYMEQQIRAAGNSGVKRQRLLNYGSSPYRSSSHSDVNMVASMHNHPQQERMMGIGEVVVVLNGVEFRTRHLDYNMVQRHHDDPQKRQDVAFPDVPPEVTGLGTVEEQITEMTEWFRAWRDEDHSVRDYRPYFRPVLCYMEGAWTNSAGNTIDEPFESERHHLDATSWLDLMEKMRFLSYTGGKDSLENMGLFPTTIMNVRNTTGPILAQWNFDMLCHPLKHYLPRSSLQAVNDIKARMALGGATMEEYEATRTARYKLTGGGGEGRSREWDILDELMAQIPGWEGYGGALNDTALGRTSYTYQGDKPLNTAFYHRWYKVKDTGASGRHTRHRGFYDEDMFVAQTKHHKVAGMDLRQCHDKHCITTHQRWTYALPMELIYMTPLHKWNPYNIVHHGLQRTRQGKHIFRGPRGPRSRNGRQDPDRAYNGINDRNYLLTPREFFMETDDINPADTGIKPKYVLDQEGEVRSVKPAGFQMIMPDIPGVGRLRQRYPIFPIHSEGSPVWKELAALTDIMLAPTKYKHMLREDLTCSADNC